MSDEFIGRGWAFPLRTDATGGIALVAREREIEEAIRLVLGTSPGERPMRPEFGCRIHDYVFASADGATASAIAAEVREALAALGAPGRRRGRRRSRSTPDDAAVMYIDIQLRHPADQRPPQPRVPVLRDPGRRLIMALPVPNLDDRRFQDLVDDAKRLVQQRCPEWSDHNVSDPGVTLIELFAWMTDQVALPPQPRPGPQLRQVPRAHRGQPLSADGRTQPDHVLAVGAAAGRRHDLRRRPRWPRSAPTPTRRSRSRRSRTCRSSRPSWPRSAR